MYQYNFGFYKSLLLRIRDTFIINEYLMICDYVRGFSIWMLTEDGYLDNVFCIGDSDVKE